METSFAEGLGIITCCSMGFIYAYLSGIKFLHSILYNGSYKPLKQR